MLANRTDWRSSDPGAAARRDEPSCAAIVCTGIEPDVKPRSSRAMPFRSAAAVATMSTRLSGSSTQSTGTSWIRSPAAFGKHQQFGVEEPTGVGDVGKQSLRDVGADRLEPALRVARSARRESDLRIRL